MSLTVEDLCTASNNLRDYVKDQNRGTEIQEFQMMGLYGTYYIAANYRRASRLIPTDVSLINGAIGWQGKVKSAVRANSAKVAAGKNTAQQLVIIDGVSDSDTIIHAEQTLLLVLAYKLKDGMTAPNVAIGGCKVPCSKCFTVLTALADAYKQEYKKVLDFNGNRVGAYNTNGDAKIKKLDLDGIFADDKGKKTFFADMVASYTAAL